MKKRLYFPLALDAGETVKASVGDSRPGPTGWRERVRLKSRADPLKKRLVLPVAMSCQSTIGYRPDLVFDLRILDSGFGQMFLEGVIIRMAEANLHLEGSSARGIVALGEIHELTM